MQKQLLSTKRYKIKDGTVQIEEDNLENEYRTPYHRDCTVELYFQTLLEDFLKKLKFIHWQKMTIFIID